MSGRQCWVCQFIDTFICKVLPYLLAVAAGFAGGFITRNEMAKDVWVRGAVYDSNNQLVEAVSFTLKTTEQKDDSLSLLTETDENEKRIYDKCAQLRISAERIND